MSERRRAAGFSLVEVLFASVIMAVLILGTYLVVVAGLRAQDSGGRFGYLDERGRILLSSIASSVQSSNILYVEASSTLPPRIDFQLPVDPDGNGSVVNSVTGNVDWGAHEKTGDVLGNYHRIQFQATKTISESTIKWDLNQDGDRNDIFAVGKMVETTSGGTVTKILGTDVILVYGSYQSDLNLRYDSDGDGSNSNAGEDRTFVRLNDGTGKAKQITVNFWLLGKDGQNRYVTRHFREIVMLRNTQS